MKFPFENLVREIPDFPKPGILFLDISPLLADPGALQALADAMVEPFDLTQVDVFEIHEIALIEATD